MILTVTLNPLVEHRLAYETLNFGVVNRNADEEYKAGGKGINVSRQLNLLEIQNLAFTFLGGYTGKHLKKLITEEKIRFSSIQIQNETRNSVVIIDKSARTVTSYFGNDPVISISESEEFKNKLEKMIQNCEIVVFSGSSPCEETNSIFPFGIEIANKYDKISVCDTYGDHLIKCIESSPTIIHNNIDEVEKSLRISLRSEKEMTDYLQFLREKNIKQSYITDGANPTYAANMDYHFKVVNPSINTIDSTGSGDAFVAGIVHGWQNNFPFEETLTFATSLGAANAAKFDACSVNIDEAEQLKNNIKVTSVGKQMRLVDVKST